SMRHVEIVDRLLAAGAQLEQRLPGEVTVLMLAAALGLPDLCAKLMTAGANVHATDAQGLTPLHCAALYGFTARDRTRLVALFDTLLLAGAEVDAAAAGGVTPLLLLLGARAEPGTACDEDVLLAVLEHLLDEGAMLDARDPRGFGPLHLAALHGLLLLTRRLLRAGADPEARDALNRTPREIAVMRGFVDVAHESGPLQAGGSMARFLRDRSSRGAPLSGRHLWPRDRQAYSRPAATRGSGRVRQGVVSRVGRGPAWLDIASGSRGMEMRHRARWCVLLMWLAAGVAQAAGMAEVRKQVEATMLVTGRVTITLEGTVRDWTIDQRDKLPPAVANVIDAAAPGWRFEPILLDGKPAHGSARMSLLMVAERVD